MSKSALHKLRYYSSIRTFRDASGLFLGWFRYGLLRLGLPKDYLFIILLPFSLCYGLMTGWTASVLRSLIQSLLTEFGIKKTRIILG